MNKLRYFCSVFIHIGEILACTFLKQKISNYAYTLGGSFYRISLRLQLKQEQSQHLRQEFPPMS